MDKDVSRKRLEGLSRLDGARGELEQKRESLFFCSSWASYHVVRRKRGEEGRGRKE